MAESFKDRHHTQPAGVKPSGGPVVAGNAREGYSPAIRPNLSRALQAVDVKFRLTMYQIAKESDGFLSPNYLYKLCDGDKENPSYEVFNLTVSGIRNARGIPAAVFFVLTAFGLDQEYDAGEHVAPSDYPDPGSMTAARLSIPANTKKV